MFKFKSWNHSKENRVKKKEKAFSRTVLVLDVYIDKVEVQEMIPGFVFTKHHRV